MFFDYKLFEDIKVEVHVSTYACHPKSLRVMHFKINVLCLQSLFHHAALLATLVHAVVVRTLACV